MSGKRPELDDIVAQVNEKGEGIWNVAIELEDKDDYWEVWLIDYNEYLDSYNFQDGFEFRNVIYPLEQAVIEQTGDANFYFDAYDFAGRFVGSASK